MCGWLAYQSLPEKVILNLFLSFSHYFSRHIHFVIPALEQIKSDDPADPLHTIIRRFNFIMRKLINEKINSENVKYMATTEMTQYHPDNAIYPTWAEQNKYFMEIDKKEAFVSGKLFADVQVMLNYFCQGM